MRATLRQARRGRRQDILPHPDAVRPIHGSHVRAATADPGLAAGTIGLTEDAGEFFLKCTAKEQIRYPHVVLLTRALVSVLLTSF
jgi:hypothetical protein